MKKILFVCTGNTCRSCMAEGIFNASIEKDMKLRGRMAAHSAGTAAFDGDAASAHAVKVLQDEWGIDIRTHRSRALTADHVNEADLILTMTRDHKNAVLALFPGTKGKVFTLKEFVREGQLDREMESYDFSLDIMDPFGMNLQAYKKCALEIKEAVEKLVRKLESL